MSGANSFGDPSGRFDSVVIVAGGSPIDASTVSDLPTSAVVVAADSGLDRALALGWHVDVVVGDMDSVSSAALADAERGGAELVRHPGEKDETDLEIALALAVDRGAHQIIVVGADGGRFDHLLANALVLASPWLASATVEARFGSSVVRVVRDTVVLIGRPGGLVSLLPLHGPAHGVVTEGLRYPLRAETLWAGSPRGMSNEFEETTARVSLTDGVIVAITSNPTDPDPTVAPALPDERGNS